ncbi:putative phosphoglycerate dehydrogenase [Candidatus Planktophila dulcis]|jgi:phosphoglycerate dehydrogenase-like enzyme|uniref:NAD(P)-dependent oxidoreductase n=1 Tax=Candidatus Planktophila dulcis TaxID=1884914 RepID=UPI000BAC64DE|nr:NAD(P)-dependent oxidoreductase [Candidatus Planktophila dulcis]ASY15035.1 putative phosphoglycerate dehydrogenase [Candidatus Planktophila dulcis]
MSSINVWTQWDDLSAPAGITLLSPENFPLDTSDLSQIDFYVPLYMGGAKALSYAAQMPNLKTLQMLNAGYDDALAYLRPGLTLCNARGVHDASTAELAVGLAIASRRGFPEFMREQIAGRWSHHRTSALSDSKIGIIGYGSIGKKIAKNLSGFEVSVTAFTQSGRDGSLTIDQLDAHLPELDIIILILPLSDSSRHLFNAKRLAAMKDGALLINVARGPVVETDALVKELNSGRIFAALDVTDPEPLPTGHPLWSAKNLLLLPHVGGNSDAFEPRGRALVQSQLQLLAAGAPLEHVVAQG